MTARCLLVVVVAGCGRLGFDAVVDGATRTADVPLDACTFGPWSARIALTELNTPSIEYGNQISADGLSLYYDSNAGSSNFDLYVAKRPDRATKFSPAVAITELDTAADEGDPTISADELEIIFYRSAGTGCLYQARRASRSDPWGPAIATTICTADGPFLSRDGLTLYYNTVADSTFEGVLYTTTRATTADLFGPGAPIPELMSGANKGYPALTPDELGLVFEMANGNGDLDLWLATRPTKSDPWGAPVQLAGLDSASNDGDPSFTADGTEIFFESEAPAGNPDMFHATRSCQ